jgi:hypothetical protein
VGWVIGGGQVALRALVLTAATTAISSFYRGHAARKKCRTLLKSGEPLPGAHQDQPMMEGKTDIIRNLSNALIEETRRITKGEVLEQNIALKSGQAEVVDC